METQMLPIDGKEVVNLNEPPFKKMRNEITTMNDNDFIILMPSSTALKTAVEIMSHTLIDVTFKIDKAENDTVFLRVDAMDSGSICACKVRLKCTGNCSDENDFCVKLKPLLEILRPLPGNEGIQLFRKKGKSDVELKTLGCESHHYKLRTLQDSYYREALESCETTYSVDFDLAKLKSHLRVITNLKADTLKIQIFKLLATNSLIFKLSCDGLDASAEWNFFSSSNGGALGFWKQDDSQQKKVLYDEEYSTEYLKNFTKSMERSSVTLSFNNDDPKVLVVEYSLGQEDSSIIFLLAPKISGD